MEPGRLASSMYRVQHRHKDGSWADMEEVSHRHDSADHDPERGWGMRRLFRCRTCEESAELAPVADDRHDPSS